MSSVVTAFTSIAGWRKWTPDTIAEPDTLRIGREEREHRVALRLVGLGSSYDQVLPDVVGEGDAVEARLLRGTRDLGQPRGEPLRSLFPVEAVELHS